MISKKCMYALKAVLALARNSGDKPMTIHQIAEREKIPARFLEAILRDLKQNGLTDSVRGKDGGYLLAVSPRDISVGQIVRLLDGPWFQSPEPNNPTVFDAVWAEAQEKLTSVLDQKDFHTLAREHDELNRADIINYTI